MVKYTNKDKENAWKAFSEYNRMYWCLKTTGEPFLGVCITCGRRFVKTALEAGHFVGGRSNAVIFSMKFVNPQCAYCNRIMHGETKKYREALYERHGKEYVDRWEMKLKAYAKMAKIGTVDWVERTRRYKWLLNRLKEPYKFRL